MRKRNTIYEDEVRLFTLTRVRVCSRYVYKKTVESKREDFDPYWKHQIKGVSME